MATTELTAKSFETTIDKGIVFVDFWASWCAPCRMFAPIYEKAAQKHTDVVFGKVNTEQEQDIAGAFGINAIPTLMIFRDGIPLFQQAGVLPAAALDDLVAQVRALDMNEVRKKVAEVGKGADA